MTALPVCSTTVVAVRHPVDELDEAEELADIFGVERLGNDEVLDDDFGVDCEEVE